MQRIHGFSFFVPLLFLPHTILFHWPHMVRAFLRGPILLRKLHFCISQWPEVFSWVTGTLRELLPSAIC